MTNAQANEPILRKPLRLWPGVLIVALQWLGRFGVPLVVPEAMIFGVFGGLVGGLAVVVWWAFLSRAPRAERWGAIGLMILGLVAIRPLLHESIATAGMGFLFPIYAVPLLSLAFVIWAVASRGLSDWRRRATMVATILLTCGVWTLVRTGGITNEGDSEFAWRWKKTPEELLLAQAAAEPTTPPSDATAEPSSVNWPGFRGPNRDGVVPDVRIETDWEASPPVELWRRPIGPGWGSFAVQGDVFFTQEQRGEEEIVACYRLSSGEPVWRHGDPTRFWESNAGAGPRATPTLVDGRVYSLGATGILNVLEATDGAVVWSRNAASDTGVAVPIWGFSSSPLVVDDVVVVATAGQMVAYDFGSGEPRWFGPDGGSGYSSPHLATIDGVDQALLASLSGIVSLAPIDGSLLWKHAWPGGGRIVQPALVSDRDLLVSRGETTGIRRITVVRQADGWTTEERWTSIRLKPYFSDFVVHAGHAFGVDGSILASIDIETGERNWKGGRYGSGQIVLLPDQELLLVLTEQGELALVNATPERFTELARFPAVEGKTWNHPVLIGDILLVRNDREMVAFRLSLAGS